MNRRKVVCFLIWAVICFVFVSAGYHDVGLGGAIFGAFISGLLAIPIFIAGFVSGGPYPEDRLKALFYQDYNELKEKYGPILKKVWVDVRSSPALLGSNWVGGRSTLEVNICKDALFISVAEGCFCIQYSQHPIRKKEGFFRNTLVVENVSVPEAFLKKISAIFIDKMRTTTFFLSTSRKEDIDFIMAVVQQVQKNGPRDAY